MWHNVDINGKALRLGWWALAVIVFGVVIAIRIRLLGIPLERDEGEYAYAGQLILQGIPPYKLAYNMKFPGTYGAYAVIMSIFGQTIAGIHLGLVLTNAVTIALIFLLGRRLINSTAGIVAAMTYAVLSIDSSVLGLAAHATHFVVLTVVAGVLLLLNESGNQLYRLFASGLLFGVSLLMKQPAVFFVVFAAIYLLSRDVHRHFKLRTVFLRNLVFSAGVILPFAITCMVLWHTGVFGKFWFWTVDYARQYGTLVPLNQAPQIFFRSIEEVIGDSWAVWVLATIGAVAGCLDSRMRSSTLFLLGFLFTSVVTLCPGFYFRYHYFILVLPAVSLLVGVAITMASNALSSRMVPLKFLPLFLLAIALCLPIARNRDLLFVRSPIEACRIIYPESPFPECVRISDYVREHSSVNDTIAVLGSEPEIYFYSQRHSATGYIYTYGLMEPQIYARQMQQEMIQEIERAAPKYLISVIMNDSWLQRSQSDRSIFKWATEYTARNYNVTGFVNLVGPGRTDYYFGDVPQSVEQLGSYILIYERKS